MAEKYRLYVTHAWKEWAEDSYGDGEIGRRNEYDMSRDAQGVYNSWQQIAKALGLTEDPEAWIGFDGPRLLCQQLEDDDGTEAFPEEIERWKKGELRLWSATYNFEIQLVTEKTPTAKELSDITGLKEY